MRTSIKPRPVLVRGMRRHVLIARTTYPRGEGVTASVVGDWREGDTTRAEALRAALPLRAMVRAGASHFELCTAPGNSL